MMFSAQLSWALKLPLCTGVGNAGSTGLEATREELSPSSRTVSNGTETPLQREVREA